MGHRQHARWRVAAEALAAGLALAVVLLVLAPAEILVRIGTPITALAPVRASGVHGVEGNYGHLMRWTNGHARLRWPGRYGVDPEAVVITLAGYPGRQPDRMDVRVDGRLSRHVVPGDYGDVRVDLPAARRGPIEVGIESLTSSTAWDARDLGVRLESLRLPNRPLVDRLWMLGSGRCVLVMLLGACAWLAGIWAAGPGASVTRRRVAGAGALLAVASALANPTWPWLASWTMLPPFGVGIVSALVLARGGLRRHVAAACGTVIALACATVTAWCVAAFVDAPRFDVWEVIVLLQRQEAVGLTIADLWHPHNEHRPVVARAVMLANIALSDWNHWNELWMLLAAVGTHVLVLVRGLARDGVGGRVSTALAAIAIVTFVATPTQWENLLQGWQVTLVVGVLVASAALVLLSGGTTTWRRLGAAASLATLGTASFGSCLVVWPLGAMALWVRRQPGWTTQLLAWLVIGAVVSAAFLHGLEPNPAHPPPAPIFRSATALLRVMYGACLALALPVWYAPEVFLAQPRTIDVWLLPAVGATGLAVAAACIAVHLWRGVEPRGDRWLLPALLIGLAAAAAGVTAIGRVGFGLHALTASRYIAFSALFWVGLVWLLTVASPWRSRGARLASTLVAAVIVLAGLRAWADSRPYFESHFVGGSLARDALLRGDVGDALALFPGGPVLDERQQFLKRHRLSLFRRGAGW